MSIRDWPAAERPREKLLEQGAAALTDAELLAIFLRTGVAGCSAVDLARRLLAEFGSLRALLEAELPDFSQHLGLGPAKYAQLQAVLEMARRHLAERLRRDSALESPQVVRDYLKAQLRHELHEAFGCLFLDAIIPSVVQGTQESQTGAGLQGLLEFDANALMQNRLAPHQLSLLQPKKLVAQKVAHVIGGTQHQDDQIGSQRLCSCEVPESKDTGS